MPPRRPTRLTFTQSCPATPGPGREAAVRDSGRPGPAGRARPRPAAAPGRRSRGARAPRRVLSVTEAEQTFTFVDVADQPLPSLLRGFSAPVKLSFPYSRDQLMFLMQHDSDGFNRWEAGQQLSRAGAAGADRPAAARRSAGAGSAPDRAPCARVLADEQLDQAMVAEMLRCRARPTWPSSATWPTSTPSTPPASSRASRSPRRCSSRCGCATRPTATSPGRPRMSPKPGRSPARSLQNIARRYLMESRPARRYWPPAWSSSSTATT